MKSIIHRHIYPWLICVALFGSSAFADSPAKFAFPNHQGPGPFCSTPSAANSTDAQNTYDYWKKTLITRDGANGFRRVVRPDTPDGVANSTVSEGIAYGMLLTVYYNDQSLFDDLFQYSQHWADQYGLMQWYIDPKGEAACPGRPGSGCGGATDADEDIAFALIMADKQWGGSGSLTKTYREHALRQIALVKKYEVSEEGFLMPGEYFGGKKLVNLSYFAPAFFEVFGRYSNDEKFWKKVVDVNYSLLFKTLNKTNGNADNGLVPAWSNTKGEPEGPWKTAPTHHQTDSVRMPIRVAQHYCWTGDKRAKRYIDKVNQFFVPIGYDNITDGYALDGKPWPEAAPAQSSRSAVFVAAAAMAAMTDKQNDAYVTGAYSLLKTNQLNVRSTYYQLSWTALSMAFLTGNFFDMTQGQSTQNEAGKP